MENKLEDVEKPNVEEPNVEEPNKGEAEENDPDEGIIIHFKWKLIIQRKFTFLIFSEQVRST